MSACVPPYLVCSVFVPPFFQLYIKKNPSLAAVFRSLKFSAPFLDKQLVKSIAWQAAETPRKAWIGRLTHIAQENGVCKLSTFNNFASFFPLLSHHFHIFRLVARAPSCWTVRGLQEVQGEFFFLEGKSCDQFAFFPIRL